MIILGQGDQLSNGQVILTTQAFLPVGEQGWVVHGRGLLHHIPDYPLQPLLPAIFRGIDPGNALLFKFPDCLRYNNPAAAKDIDKANPLLI